MDLPQPILSKPKLSPNPNPHFDEWVIHVSQILDRESVDESPITIFNAPRPLLDLYPKSYIPQQVAIGPCHSALPEIHDMQRYKLAAARKNQKKKLFQLVQNMLAFEPKIRATYQMLLDLSGETLAWIMVLDASFLFEFLRVCSVKTNKSLRNAKSSKRLSILGRNTATHNAILRDVSLVNNQIPLFVLKELLKLYYESSDLVGDELCHFVDVELSSKFAGVCEELSPFKMVLTSDKVEVIGREHLLDILYHSVVPIAEDMVSSVQDGDAYNATREAAVAPILEDKIVSVQDGDAYTARSEAARFKPNLSLIHPITLVKKVTFSKPVTIIAKLPWTILSQVMPMADTFCCMSNDEQNKNEASTTKPHVSPLMEEIEIPSVTQLVKAGVRFQPTSEGISSIKFDCITRVFYLPTINIDVNTSTVLRNLVAYEVCSSSGPDPLTLSRYIELMNGIIDTEEDAKYLRERGIVVNMLENDEEVANLWNGMSKSIRLTKVRFLDKVIEDVNKDYSMRRSIKLRNCMKRYVYGSWRILTLLGASLMVLFMGLQAFCSIYNCARILPIARLS